MVTRKRVQAAGIFRLRYPAVFHFGSLVRCNNIKFPEYGVAGLIFKENFFINFLQRKQRFQISLCLINTGFLKPVQFFYPDPAYCFMEYTPDTVYEFIFLIKTVLWKRQHGKGLGKAFITIH